MSNFFGLVLYTIKTKEIIIKMIFIENENL